MNKVVIITIIICLSSCSGSKSSSPEKATEVPNKEIVQTDLSPNELLHKSKKLYENALYSTAVESFQSLRDAYSPGPYAEFAEIKMADSNFEMRKFDAAAGNYEEFIKNHPSSKSLPYAMLRAGRSHELSNTGVGRDFAPLEKARDFYEKLIEQYPDSVYTYAGKQYYQTLADKITEQDEFVRDFYKRHENEQAVIAREKHFDTNIKPGLQKVSTKIKDHQISDSPKAALSSKANTPNILDIQRTSSLTVKRKAPLPLNTSVINDKEPDTKHAEYRVQSVNCIRENGEKIVILLNKEFNNEKFLNQNSSIESQNGTVSFRIPDTQSKEIEMDCFSGADLKISQNAVISIKTSNSADLISLINPPRLLLSFE